MTTTATVLIDWALRSLILILSGAILLRTLRVKDPSIRLAAWTAMLAGSLLVPAFSAVLPELPLDMSGLALRTVWESAPEDLAVLAISDKPVTTPSASVSRQSEDAIDRGDITTRPAAASALKFDWRSAAATVYLVVAGVLLLRVFMGLAISLRLLRDSRVTGQTTEGIEIRESKRIQAPVTLGIVRPAIVLPADWRQWDGATLKAVLAHEGSHVGRRDPALQLFSLIHRALLWHSPLSWFLHKRIVQTAEEISDDAAIAATGNRVGYAEVLLAFMEKSLLWRGADGGSAAMARYGLPEGRIHRIVHGTTLSRGVTGWSLTAILTLGSSLAYLVAAPQARPEFEVADVHVSPPRIDGRRVGQMDGVTGNFRSPWVDAVVGGRYEIRNATMMELITTAYSLEAEGVFGGPDWLTSDWDRFDVIAKPPEGRPSNATIKTMLQSLLADRFKLVVHPDTKPLSAWVLSKGTAEPRMKRAGSSDESACRIVDENERVSCRNVTMDVFVASIRAGTLTTRPVVNATGIEGSWDFDLKYSVTRGYFGVSENNPILDVIDKQLGLKLALQEIPQPVLVVESVNRNPTANAADLERRLPPPPVEFEVASIRPCEFVNPMSAGGETGARFSASGLITTGCMSLQRHIAMAWDRPGRMEGAPGWLNSKYFNIVAKASVPILDATDQKYRAMLRNLLADRFKMVSHYEDRPMDVYELVAEKPKLKKADPSGRTGCKVNGGAGFVVGIPNAMTCQNVTLAQFAEELGNVGDVSARPATRRPVVDATGLQGAWDLTLTYWQVAGPQANSDGPDRTGSPAIFEALDRQLGLKLRGAKRPRPLFVIDHIEQNPTEN